MTAVTPKNSKIKWKRSRNTGKSHSEICTAKPTKWCPYVEELGYGEGAKIYSDLPKSTDGRWSLWEKNRL
jgi:hypothetical protein